MDIYNDYYNTIRTAMQHGKKAKWSNESIAFSGAAGSLNYAELRKQVPEKRLLPSLSELSREIGMVPNFDQQLGLHPHFAHLKGSQSIEKHYIVSMFIDIKGSTNLFRKYEPENVLLITNLIQCAAIHTCLIFGGYVQRLHGDGLFVYFGGKGIDKSTAIQRAMSSGSAFSYFVKNDLKKLFDEQNLPQVSTRIGVDIGDDAEVVWAMMGLGEISEVTTCSLHTSLACKMQAKAQSNGIVAGENVKALMPNYQEHFTPVSDRVEEKDRDKERYIFRDVDENFNYRHYDFNWVNFLKRQDFFATDLKGNVNLKRKTVNISHKIPQTLKPIAIASKPYSTEK